MISKTWGSNHQNGSIGDTEHCSPSQEQQLTSIQEQDTMERILEYKD